MGRALAMQISLAGAALAWMCMEWLGHRKASLLGLVTGVVASVGALDVFAISGVSGATGSVLVAFFSSESLTGVGLVAEGGIAGQLAVQILAPGVTTAWSGFATYGLFKLLGVRGTVRVMPDQETSGMDLSVHGESGYKF